MVVHEHAAGGGHAHERPEHLARMDLDAVDRAARDLDDIEQALRMSTPITRNTSCASPASRGSTMPEHVLGR